MLELIKSKKCEWRPKNALDNIFHRCQNSSERYFRELHPVRTGFVFERFVNTFSTISFSTN